MARFFKGQVPWNAGRGDFIECPCGTTKWHERWAIEKGRRFCSKACGYKWRVLKGTFQFGHADLVPADKRGHTQDSRKKMSVSHRGKRRGPLNPNWKGGLRSERKQEMGRFEYQDWRKSVFERDDYTCQSCNIRGGYLEADHIKPWSRHVELRYEISNGRTLCRKCHQATDTWGGRAKKAA